MNQIYLTHIFSSKTRLYTRTMNTIEKMFPFLTNQPSNLGSLPNSHLGAGKTHTIQQVANSMELEIRMWDSSEFRPRFSSYPQEGEYLQSHHGRVSQLDDFKAFLRTCKAKGLFSKGKSNLVVVEDFPWVCRCIWVYIWVYIWL